MVVVVDTVSIVMLDSVNVGNIGLGWLKAVAFAGLTNINPIIPAAVTTLAASTSAIITNQAGPKARITSLMLLRPSIVNVTSICSPPNVSNIKSRSSDPQN